METASAQPPRPAGKTVAASTTITSAQARTLKTVLATATRTGDINSALAQQGRGLPAGVVAELRALGPEDLQAIARLNGKLGRVNAADNNGVVIM